jgi:hypothetical protein
MKKLLIAAVPLLLLTSCITTSHYYQEVAIDSKSKYNEEVEFLTQKPLRAAVRIGLVTVNGYGYSGMQSVINEAKRKAACIGGDFVLAEESGVTTSFSYSPGYSSYVACASSGHGSAHSHASGYFVGPSFSQTQRPWAHFSVWVYAPSQLGVRFEDDMKVIGFHLKSDADKKGIKIGDQILGIDGFDVQDPALTKHLLKVKPGNNVKLIVCRENKREEFEITTVEN